MDAKKVSEVEMKKLTLAEELEDYKDSDKGKMEGTKGKKKPTMIIMLFIKSIMYCTNTHSEKRAVVP